MTNRIKKTNHLFHQNKLFIDQELILQETNFKKILFARYYHQLEGKRQVFSTQ